MQLMHLSYVIWIIIGLVINIKMCEADHLYLLNNEAQPHLLCVIQIICLLLDQLWAPIQSLKSEAKFCKLNT